MPDPFALTDEPAPAAATAGPAGTNDFPYLTGLNDAQLEAVEA